MMTRNITIGLAALIILVDVVLIFHGQHSISRFMYDFSRDYPIVAFGLGCVVGHWFWPVKLDAKLRSLLCHRQ